MNIIEKAVEKLEDEVEQLLGQENREASKGTRARSEASADTAVRPAPPAPAAEGAAPASVAVVSGEPAAASRPPVAARDTGAGSASERVELNLAALGAAGYVTPLRDQSLLAEEFRIIKRPLLARATPADPAHVENGNLIIITSSLPGEGKTFSSINLAFSIAMELDRTVLLVDADAAKSDVSRVLGLTERQGLSNYLDGSEKDLSKLMVRTNVESLTVLPSGPRHPRFTEFVASVQMRNLTVELSERYPDRIVIFDSPPLLATSGASVLAGLMGQVVLVIEAVRTSQSVVREALRQLERVPNVSVVFNKHRRVMAGRYDYGYDYGYGYGHDATGARDTG